MKILQIAPYATCNELPLLSQCKAGFGYMVYDIAKSLAIANNVEMLLVNYRHDEFKHDGIVFRESSIGQFFKCLFHCCNPLLPVKLWLKYHMAVRTLIRVFYVWFISGYYFDVVRKGNYDVVHIHGCGFYDELFIDICRRLKQPFVITLHGLNSFSDSINIEPAGKKYERDFLLRVTKGEFPITVISSGIKRTIEAEYAVSNLGNVHVVCNAFTFVDIMNSIVRVREKYNIPSDAKMLLYVGNISRNKNQEQLIESFGMLPEEKVKNTYVLFLGRNIEQGYELESLIGTKPYKEHLILCGNIDKNEMPCYYQEADGVILLSKAEGFGLSLIEGMHFGLPCMTFTDLDAFNDIYDPCAVVALADRNNQTVAKGLLGLLQKDWGRMAIKRYSKKFESKAMAENYLKVYNIIQ